MKNQDGHSMNKRNMGIQLALAIFPLVNLYGFYRVKKLGMAVLLNLTLNGISLGVAFILKSDFMTWLGFPPYSNIMLAIPVYIYFMHRWTKQYNAKVF